MATSLRSRLLAQRALMQRLREQKRRNPLQAGFTLIELLIVVIIIGILASIAVPSFLNQRQKAYEASANSWASGEARKCATAQALDDINLYEALAAPADAVTGGAAVTSACADGAGGVYTGGGGKVWTVDSAGGVSTN